jgi:hypothetical protein
MSTAGPGYRFGDRYRLEDRIGAGRGWSAWKAIDETLARPVTVCALAPGFPRIAEAVTAARQAGRLSDARLAQVFDVDTGCDHAYVVTEWVPGDTLDDLLADGPLDPARGAEIIAQGAEALAVAHAAGVTHLCLTPRSLRCTADGRVKIVGLGLDAVLAGVSAGDQALVDTQGLGRLLYAALTARWPGGGWPSLRPAPEVNGNPRRPRQVRAGVPAGIDAVACRALFQHGPGGDPVSTPARLATELNRVMPVPGPPPSAHGAGGFGAWPGHQVQAPVLPRGGAGPVPPRGSRPAAGGRRPVTGPVMASAVVLAALAMGAGVWTARHHGGTPRADTPPRHPPAPAAAPVRVLTPVGAAGFDPLSSVANDPGNENSGQAKYVIDHDPATAWHTQFYFGNPRFGGLKNGTGLILDMGRPVRLSSVTVSFGAVPGADVNIEVGNTDTRSPATLRTFTTVSRQAGLSGTVTFRGRGAASGRYLLIWFTRLPPQTAGSTGTYEAEISDVTVRGTVLETGRGG